MNFKNLYLVAIALIFSFSSQAQTKITGKVTDFNNIPQTDVLVYIDTLKVDTKINSKGYFKIKVPEGVKSINVFSPKYGLLSSDFTGDEKMNFIFLDPTKSDAKEDMVSLDYTDIVNDSGTQNDAKINVGGNDDVIGYANIFDYIRGKVAGVTVSQNNRITIRGVKSLSAGSDPLFVVDGMPVNNIAFVDVNQVKEVKVLKNGASMYGSRGANGVLIITLKK